ncbi:MAG: SDR family NAD(P)-dependent oxidoreductase [Anaerolineae bacterium]
MFGIDGKVAIVTGATGVLGGAMARGLAQAGVKVAILGRRRERAEAVAQDIIAAGGQALATPADVLDKAQLEAARDQVVGAWGGIDILVNAAGGTTPEATIPPDRNFFQMDMDATRYVIDLNLVGTLLPCYVFGEVMAQKQQGCIINISSMNAQRAFTRSVAYSAGKTAAESLTGSLAVELATKFGEGMRVNGRRASSSASRTARCCSTRRHAHDARAEDHRPHAVRALRRAGRTLLGSELRHRHWSEHLQRDLRRREIERTRHDC